MPPLFRGCRRCTIAPQSQETPDGRLSDTDGALKGSVGRSACRGRPLIESDSAGSPLIAFRRCGASPFSPLPVMPYSAPIPRNP